MKKVLNVRSSEGGHWVGDGFPVRSLFGYNEGRAVSPFLLFDYAGPHDFAPTEGAPRGVGWHPHRGFETVTIAYEGEVSHRDSAGGGGTIRPGDVQWMTAGSGIVHEEYHSPGYSRAGGAFRMVQLWVNLPAKDKMTSPAYQPITNAQIPLVDLGGGQARVIAGVLNGTRGPAKTFTSINIWDMRVSADGEITLPVPDGHNTLIAVLSGHVTIDGQGAGPAELVTLSEQGEGVTLRADNESTLLVLTGEPIEEPVVGYGPFVMNSEQEIRQAIADFNAGRFGAIPAG